MNSHEAPTFHTPEKETETEKMLALSFSKIWNRFAEIFGSKKQGGKELLAVLEKSKGDPEQNGLFTEGEKVVELYDSAIKGVAAEARIEVASVIGKSQEVIEQIPPSKLKKFAWYNLSATPEGFISEAERVKYEQRIDLEHIEESSKDWKDYLSEKIRDNNVVLLGEAHTAETVEKKAVTEFLEQAKENGVTDIGLEIEEHLQEYVDRYLETGKFQEADDQVDYEKVGEYQKLRNEWHVSRSVKSLEAMSAFEKTVKDNFVFSSHFYEHYPILKRVRELGLRVQCIDRNQKYAQEEIDKATDDGTFVEWKQQKEAERDMRMFEKIKATVAGGDRKMIVLIGSAHLAEGELRHKNLGDLLFDDTSVKSFRVNMDRDFDADITIQEKTRLGRDINFNSVLYSALEKRGSGQIGFDLDDFVLKSGSGQQERFPFDGYVKI